MGKFQTDARVKNINGFHVRPSTSIAKAAQEYQCNINFYKKGDQTPLNAKSSLDLIAAGIPYEQEILIECEGEDAEEALKMMKTMAEKIYDFKDAQGVPQEEKLEK
jgi:phosphotransferase system HPr (HPr) family protein